MPVLTFPVVKTFERKIDVSDCDTIARFQRNDALLAPARFRNDPEQRNPDADMREHGSKRRARQSARARKRSGERNAEKLQAFGKFDQRTGNRIDRAEQPGSGENRPALREP